MAAIKNTTTNKFKKQQKTVWPVCRHHVAKSGKYRLNPQNCGPP